MSDGPVLNTELVARFIFRKDQLFATGEVRKSAFAPYPHRGASVTRHENLDPPQIWQRGAAVATERGLPLVGRADVLASAVREAELDVIPAPLPHNPEHADIVLWPDEKPLQMIRAQLVARAATYIPAPPAAQ